MQLRENRGKQAILPHPPTHVRHELGIPPSLLPWMLFSMPFSSAPRVPRSKSSLPSRPPFRHLPLCVLRGPSMPQPSGVPPSLPSTGSLPARWSSTNWVSSKPSPGPSTRTFSAVCCPPCKPLPAPSSWCRTTLSVSGSARLAVPERRQIPRLSGLRRRRGERRSRMRDMAAMAEGEYIWRRREVLALPMPCSAEREPPQEAIWEAKPR